MDKMILEKRFVCNLETKSVIENDEEYLIISGLCGHSACGIKDIEIKRQKNKIIILITISHGLKGNFEIKIKLAKDTKEVALGNDIIWAKNS